MAISLDLIRKLKEETGAPVMRVKKVLEELDGDEKKAEKILREEGFEKAAKREGRETSQGLVKAYTHHSGRIVAVVEVMCETDFVAKNELFVDLANNLAMQVASMNPKDVKELEAQDFIKDPSKKVGDLVKEVIAKTGENVKIGRICRMELGE
jgi:elongation factor Ts